MNDRKQEVRGLISKHGGYSVEELNATETTLSVLTKGVLAFSFFVELGQLYGIADLDRIKVEAETIQEGYCETCAYTSAGVKVTIE